ncbi:MAG: hypothetical protein MSC30_02325 [Gaiellaceae bacterium MAG52_C11]|nr:hypothetical protein [Candidatus Gaiellasilicea maunaloa]
MDARATKTPAAKPKPAKPKPARRATPKAIAKTVPAPRSLPRDQPLAPRLAGAVAAAEPLERGLLALGGAVLALAALGGTIVLVAGRHALRELAA